MFQEKGAIRAGTGFYSVWICVNLKLSEVQLSDILDSTVLFVLLVLGLLVFFCNKAMPWQLLSSGVTKVSIMRVKSVGAEDA